MTVMSMPDVTVVLGGFAAIGILAGTAWLAFRAGRFWGATKSNAQPMARLMSVKNPDDDAPNWERYLRERMTGATMGLVGDGVHTDDIADVLRDIADDLDTDDGGDAGR
jgi:hypothetical protein